MDTYRYFENPNTLETLQKMPRVDRERWHTRRVAREQRVYALIDQMTKSSVLLDSQLVSELTAVKSEVEQVERIIALRENAEFRTVLSAYHETLAQFKQLATAGKPTLFKYLQGKVPVSAVVKQLRREEILVDMLTVYELKIEQICIKHRVLPGPYFQLGKTLDAVRGVATRKILEEHFGYSR